MTENQIVINEDSKISNQKTYDRRELNLEEFEKKE